MLTVGTIQTAQTTACSWRNANMADKHAQFITCVFYLEGPPTVADS